MLQGEYRSYLTPEQSELLERDILLGKKAVKIDEYFFNSRAILFILPASDIERDDRIKRGDWICQKNSWHKRNEECKCVYLERMQEEYDKTQDRISESEWINKK